MALIKQRNSKQTGFTHIEVLVSVLVLAVGILGMSSLQISSLQNSSRSVLRTQAVYLSYEILDRIRANPEAAIAAIKTSAVTMGAPTATNSCVGATCSQAQLFAFDLLEWKCALGKYASSDACTALNNSLLDLNAGLPEGDGSIAINSNNEFTITIRWQEARESTEANPAYASFELKGVL